MGVTHRWRLPVGGICAAVVTTTRKAKQVRVIGSAGGRTGEMKTEEVGSVRGVGGEICRTLNRWTLTVSQTECFCA